MALIYLVYYSLNLNMCKKRLATKKIKSYSIFPSMSERVKIAVDSSRTNHLENDVLNPHPIRRWIQNHPTSTLRSRHREMLTAWVLPVSLCACFSR